MSDFTIQPISPLSIDKVLSSSKLTDTQKIEFIKHHEGEIKRAIQTKLTKADFVYLMRNRPLLPFRPIRNSFTKKGDKILLADALDISENEVDNYIEFLVNNPPEAKKGLGKDNYDKVKTYVNRHGSKDQLIKVLDHELSDVKTTLNVLYDTLYDDSLGIAGYFARPIHRLDNKTMWKILDVIDNRLQLACNAGEITDEDYLSTSGKALIRIYQIQNNNKLIKACRAYDKLTN